MRLLHTIVVVGVVLGLAVAEERTKRQAGYGQGAYEGAAPYRPAQQDQRAYQQQPQQGYSGQQVQHYPAQQPQRPVRQHNSAPDEEEKEQGPHPLQLLLEKSKFECGGMSDGYYADSDVGCQAFHYCVTGQKHSMMCPAGTVFHQVHLNCVPNDQDICSKANKFFFVNDYLNKELEQRGPNNTVQYHQRYYPEGYAVGDPFIPPQDSKKDHREPPAATYGLGPAYREQAPPQSYQQPAPAHRPQPAPYRPAPQQPQVQHYPAQPPPRPAYHQQPAAPRPQQAQPVVYGYGAQQQQAHQQHAQQAQRAYAQQQYQAAAPPQQYAQQAPRQRYA